MKVAVTGGRGYLGQMLVRELTRRGVECLVLDYYGGLLFDCLTRRYWMPLPADRMDGWQKKSACLIRKIQKRLFRVALALKLFRETGFDINAGQEELVSAFEACEAVIHLAAIPHPGVRGKTEQDFIQMNGKAAEAVFEAAATAGVTRFVFASSGQVYNINQNTDWRNFPIREEDAEIYQQNEEQHIYGKLKWKFERYLVKNSRARKMKSFALRLELPGIWGASEQNMFVQVSVENLAQAFHKSLIADVPDGGYVLNIADAELSLRMGNPGEFIRRKWLDVPCRLADGQVPFCLKTAKKIIGFQPETGGKYYHPWVAF